MRIARKRHPLGTYYNGIFGLAQNHNHPLEIQKGMNISFALFLCEILIIRIIIATNKTIFGGFLLNFSAEKSKHYIQRHCFNIRCLRRIQFRFIYDCSQGFSFTQNTTFAFPNFFVYKFVSNFVCVCVAVKSK